MAQERRNAPFSSTLCSRQQLSWIAVLVALLSVSCISEAAPLSKRSSPTEPILMGSMRSGLSVLTTSARVAISSHMGTSASAFDEANLTPNEETLQLALNTTCNLHRANKILNENITQGANMTESFMLTLRAVAHESLEETCEWLKTAQATISVQPFNFACNSDELDTLCGLWDTLLLRRRTGAKIESFKGLLVDGQATSRDVNEVLWIQSAVKMR